MVRCSYPSDTNKSLEMVDNLMKISASIASSSRWIHVRSRALWTATTARDDVDDDAIIGMVLNDATKEMGCLGI